MCSFVSARQDDRSLSRSAPLNHCDFGKAQFLTPPFVCVRLIDILGLPIQFDRCQFTEVSHETHAFRLRRCRFVRCGRCCQRRGRYQFSAVDVPRPAVAMQCVFRSITSLRPISPYLLVVSRQASGGLVRIIKHLQSCPQFLWTTLWKSSQKWLAAGLSSGIDRNAQFKAERDTKRPTSHAGPGINPPHSG